MGWCAGQGSWTKALWLRSGGKRVHAGTPCTRLGTLHVCVSMGERVERTEAEGRVEGSGHLEGIASRTRTREQMRR